MRAALEIVDDSRGIRRFSTEVSEHAVYAFFITSLIGLLQLKYQNKDVSPLETHPTTMKTFIITLSIYCSTLAAKVIDQPHHLNYSQLFGCLSPIFGALSSISLLSIFLPHWFCWLIFILWALMPIIASRYILNHIYQYFYRRIINAVPNVLEILGRPMGRNLMDLQRFLV
ncbi:unnamed protein product [Ilex paraguariensis]|uniref:Transmembrane protein n=1 Tax=Ilex paraguariensis TaxID=185542 RepID=A0ABC8TWG2_9AQUA